ncbi:hypothetical protein B0H15DRAFT_802172 [Mycena belliarum]|uniref:Uncharacterized protein n=1 Tax=Mycena belliarum TaxID=1033014 RepID=A0AAD6TZ87_9AGAR|nr:hypothetical protein B0H15DRAFT_802172 [Mycena belliae]
MTSLQVPAMTRTSPHLNDTSLQTEGPESDQERLARAGFYFRAPRPRVASPKSTAAQLAAARRYRKANRDEEREKARTRMARRREAAKGTPEEETLKLAGQAASARYRARNTGLLALRQRARRDNAYCESHGWDAFADKHERRRVATLRRESEREEAREAALARAEEQEEWAARRREEEAELEEAELEEPIAWA